MYSIYQQLDKKLLISIIREMLNIGSNNPQADNQATVYSIYIRVLYTYCIYIYFYLYFWYTDTFVAGKLRVMLKYI